MRVGKTKMNKKLYKKIRLEFNEGLQGGQHRHEWKNSVRELPPQLRPSEDEQGYNKHYYEVIDNNGDIMKFRLDVEAKNHLETFITEEEVERFITERTI